MPTKETYAARALLAYHNFGLARRLARKVLAEARPEAKKKIVAAIMELIPEAVRTILWQQIQDHVSKVGAEYIASPAFASKVRATFEMYAGEWVEESIHQAILTRSKAHVESYAKSYDATNFMKAIPGRFQAAVEEQIKILATVKAAERVNGGG